MTGIICVDKPKDITSFGVISKIKRIFNEKKVGHAGTLDPMATGVLPVLLGGATRFLDFLPVSDKSYIAKMKLGITTDTLDITGKVQSEQNVTVKKDDVEKVLAQFRGEIKQLPPMFSAVQKNGVRLYELARKGLEIERDVRTVTVYEINLLNYDENINEYEIYVSCSSGTYIRTIISDIGTLLGCGAVMTELRRTSASGLKIENCFTLESLDELKENGKLQDIIIPVEEVVKVYDCISVTQLQAIRFQNGGELSINRLSQQKSPGIYRVYSPEDDFLGLGEIKEGSESLNIARLYFEK